MIVSVLVVVAFNNSEAKKLVIATATASPVLVARLGQPIGVGWWITGSIAVTPGFGNAELTIPVVTGPKCKGTIWG